MATAFRHAFQEAEEAPRTLAQAFKRAKVIAQPANVMPNDNPTKNGACNWEKRVIADYKVLKDMRVVSTPKGAGKEHVLHATYDGLRRVETFA